MLGVPHWDDYLEYFKESESDNQTFFTTTRCLALHVQIIFRNKFKKVIINNMLLVWLLKVPYISSIASLFWNRSPKNRLRQLRVRNDSCEIHPVFQVLIALIWELSQQLLPSNRSREKSNRKEYLHQWQMIQASIKACYSDYSLLDVGNHKNSLLVNQFNPMRWHGQWMNEKSQEDKNPFGPGYQIYTSPDAWRYQSGRVWALLLHWMCIWILSLLFRKSKESISGASWKHILEEEASKIFTRRSCPHFRLSGERIIQTTRSCASLRTLDRQGRTHFRREHLEASQVSLCTSGAQLEFNFHSFSLEEVRIFRHQHQEVGHLHPIRLPYSQWHKPVE